MLSKIKTPIVSVNKLDVYKSNANSKQKVLSGLNFDIYGGEILSIIGPNGAGKSTLLHSIFDGINTNNHIKSDSLNTDLKLRARQVAFLTQNNSLNFPFLVEEVIELARTPHKTGKHIDQEIVSQVLNELDIEYLRYRPYTMLSGGEKQRVQLARVLAQIWRKEDSNNEVRLLLLDEPTTALDLAHQQSLMNSLKRLAKNNVAVVMVLHDINLVANFSDTILALICGQQAAWGHTEEVITPQTIEKIYNVNAQVIKIDENDIERTVVLFDAL